jgi:hypothetical protein
MRQKNWRQHFPTLLGYLPRMVVSLSRSLVTVIRRYIHELLLAIPFVGLFIAVVVGTWGNTFFEAQTVVVAGILLFSSYLLLLLVVKQRQEQRQNPANASTNRRDQDH